MLHRPAVGFSYGSFLLMGLRSSIYGQILSLKNHIQCPFPCKSAWGLVLCHPSIYLIPTTCCSLCTMKRFQPFFFLPVLLPLSVPEGACLLLDCTSLKAACLHLLLTSIADLLPRSVQQSASVPRSEFGVFDHSWVNNFYIFCLFSLSRIYCTSVLISHSVHLQSDKTSAK